MRTIKLDPKLAIGAPWAHGDSYPHRGTLANAEANPTTPQGRAKKGGERFDTRDFRVECVYLRTGKREVVYLPTHNFRKHAEYTRVVSRAKALDIVRDSKSGTRLGTVLPARYKHGTHEGRARTFNYGPWKLVAVAN